MPTMKTYRYTRCDCEHDGDVSSGKDLVCQAIAKAGATGHVTKTHWSGEEGDDAYIWFTIPEDKFEAVKAAIEELE